MSLVNPIVRRPALATTAFAVVLAAVLMVLPVSYEHVVGNDVTLTLSGRTDLTQAQNIAGQIKSMLGVDHVSLEATEGPAGSSLALKAYVPASAHVDAGVRLGALARALNERGFSAAATVAPRKERVSTPMYAYARDLVIRVSTDGKTAAQIESEIRQRLAEAGISNTNVSVTDENGKRKVTVMAHQESNGGTAPALDPIQLELTKNGAPLGAQDGVTLQVKKHRGPDGVSLHIDVTDKGRTTTVDVPHSDTLSDAALAREIQAQLDSAGFAVKVTVTNGQIGVETK